MPVYKYVPCTDNGKPGIYGRFQYISMCHVPIMANLVFTADASIHKSMCYVPATLVFTADASIHKSMCYVPIMATLVFTADASIHKSMCHVPIMATLVFTADASIHKSMCHVPIMATLVCTKCSTQQGLVCGMYFKMIIVGRPMVCITVYTVYTVDIHIIAQKHGYG